MSDKGEGSIHGRKGMLTYLGRIDSGVEWCYPSVGPVEDL